jgi:hypothetical protein
VLQGTFDGKNVAIKVPDAGTPEEADNVSMMRTEADVLSKCQHRQVDMVSAGRLAFNNGARMCLRMPSTGSRYTVCLGEAA